MTDKWQPFTGEYEKIWYDIKLTHGHVIHTCYPNADTFHTIGGQVIDGKAVKYIRKSEGHPMDRR